MFPYLEENGLVNLFFKGVSKGNNDPTVNLYTGEDYKQWVSITDFKNIFPDDLTFSVRYQSITHKVNLFKYP
ncbi:MAG: hypothetical protein KGD66_06990 [Candidatus Lokiarchaeota archaeon]|nr:hypothetical protein [Candidatus Lokiarchaeota archaeon]